MEIVLVRHAQPEWAPGGLTSTDPYLTDLGHAQAERLRHRQWGPVDHLWVSPFIRARQTVVPVADQLGHEPAVLDWLAEIGPSPDWEGSPQAHVLAAFEEMSRRPVDELWDGMPGAESFRDFHARVTSGLESSLAHLGMRPANPGGVHLWNGDSDRRLVLVAHGGTNAVILGHLLGLDPTPWEWERFDLMHTGVAVLKTRPMAGHLVFGMTTFGDATHLDPDMVTR